MLNHSILKPFVMPLLLGLTLFCLLSCGKPEAVKKGQSYQCPECPKCDALKGDKKVSKKKVKKRKAKKRRSCKPKVVYKKLDKLVIGSLEKVYFPKYKVKYTARIDTGAKTSSMHALNLVEFERDGQKWVKFDILSNDKDKKLINIEKPLSRIVRIKDHKNPSINDRRYVVKIRYNISSISYFGEINLTDRSNFKYPILIGRNFIRDNAIVDVAKQFTKRPTTEEK